MRAFLFIFFICTFFSPLWCQRLEPNQLNSFFVSRRDNKEAVCISPAFSGAVLPTFDLDILQTPQFVGFKFWDNWFDGWKLQNQTNVPSTGVVRKLIAGDQPFQIVGRVINEGHKDTLAIYLLAANISIWITPDGNRSGLLLQLDHWNFTTNVKDTTLKYCDQNPEVEGATCTIEDFKIGTNCLDGGNRWTWLQISLKENRTEIDMLEITYGKVKPVGQWTWNNTNISDPLTPQNDSSAVFVKSHQRNAALTSAGFDKLDLANKTITKKYSKKKRGKLCVFVYWDELRFDDEKMQVKNLASGRVQPATNTPHGKDLTFFQWNHLDAGEYEITLRLAQRQPRYIDLCPDSAVAKTWMSVPKAITNCFFFVNENEHFYTWPSSTPDATLKTNWTLDDWAYVCDRLGIGSNDAEVQIKFCNKKGCNFSKCPHLQLEPSHLFDFASVNMTPVNSIKDNERPNFFSSLWWSIKTAIF